MGALAGDAQNKTQNKTQTDTQDRDRNRLRNRIRLGCVLESADPPGLFSVGGTFGSPSTLQFDLGTNSMSAAFLFPVPFPTMVDRPDWKGRLFSSTAFRMRVPPSAESQLRVGYAPCSAPHEGTHGVVPVPWGDTEGEPRMCYTWRLAAQLSQAQLDQLLDCSDEGVSRE
jgi:hypothetical protein